MEGSKIIQAVNNLFKSVDDRDWEYMQTLFADSVLLDYTSMVGGEPAVQTPLEIKEAWASFMPGFDSTQHHISEFRVKLHGHEADVHYIGNADHFIGDEVWTISGSYDTKLEKIDGNWLITYLKLNYDKQSGNLYLPKRARERVSNLQS